MVKKYGSGNFCSRSCANSHRNSGPLKGTNTDKMKKSQEKRKKEYNKLITEYNKNPNKCIICNKELSYADRNNIICSNKCVNKYNKNKINHVNINNKNINLCVICNIPLSLYERNNFVHSNKCEHILVQKITEYGEYKGITLGDLPHQKYYKNPIYCKECGKMLSYHQHKNNQIFCSHNCSNAHKKISYTKYGFYKGIRCDSS